MESLYVKNMVCPRCIETVKDVCNELQIEIIEVRLGELKTKNKLTLQQINKLNTKLKQKGFELLEDQNYKLINQIKSIVIDQIHHRSDSIHMNYSTLLSEQLHHEYTSMSKLFSSVEGITIERFILKQKVERVKELLFYNELTLTEIAYQMNYSSVAHLSAQFKKETGMTPTAFKEIRKPGHSSLDSL